MMALRLAMPRDEGVCAQGRRASAGHSVRAFLGLCLAAACFVLQAQTAVFALQPIVVGGDQDRIEITRLGDYYEGRGDRLQIETAPGTDGIVGRMAIKARTSGTNPSWMVFALRNATDKSIERWVTAERYNIIGSGLIWPDLDARRIETLTPSVGFVPERVKSDRADIFRITIDPGQTITFVAELSSERVPSLYLWNPVAYEQKQRDRSLFNGILLGIVGLLAIFLTAIYAANHKAIFPAAALVTWSVLAYLCIEFSFWHKLFQLRPDDNAIYRAAAEAACALSISVFLYSFLRAGAWRGFFKLLFGLWLLVQVTIVAGALVDPRLAAMLARASLVPIAIVGSVVLLALSLRGQVRALSLVPTWMLLLVWLFGASVTITGRLNGEIVQSALVAGLVLIVVLIGFTVTQFAFRGGDPLYGSSPSALQTRSLAIESSGTYVWEWNARRDEVLVSEGMETLLGLEEGSLSRRADDFLQHMHPQDRDRYRQTLVGLREKNGGPLHLEFRLKHADGAYRWFELEGASVPSADHKSLKCVGLIRETTDAKRAQERLVHDAVHDSLTGLPNRELFLDRLQVAMTQARHASGQQPIVMLIGIDRFKSVNSAFGLIVGDGLLLTLARRLARHLDPQDTLARIGGDQFAVLVSKTQTPQEIALFAERVRRSLRTPVRISGKDIVLTGSIGIAGFDGRQATHHDLLRDAESAMHRAKQGGADRIEVFKPEMRSERDDRISIESDLRRAIEKGQLRIFYQPIIRLPHEELAGFEALVRWNHPQLGLMPPDEFIPIAEESDLISKLGSFVLQRASQDAARWQQELPRDDAPLFVSVNVSSRQLFRQDLVAEFRHIIGRQETAKGTLRLEVTESLVMENPEQAAEILEWLKSSGASLALDDFGAGYSSLAYLHRFPFDTIKVDRALLRSGTAQATGRAIIKSIVTLAHELGKTVVAEGVETLDDAVFLRSIDCEYAQGFYYGEPMGEKDVLELLRLLRKSENETQGSWFGSWRRRGDKAVASAPQPENARLVEAQNAGTSKPSQPPPSVQASPPMAGGSMHQGRASGGASSSPAAVSQSSRLPQPPTSQPSISHPQASQGVQTAQGTAGRQPVHAGAQGRQPPHVAGVRAGTNGTTANGTGPHGSAHNGSPQIAAAHPGGPPPGQRFMSTANGMMAPSGPTPNAPPPLPPQPVPPQPQPYTQRPGAAQPAPTPSRTVPPAPRVLPPKQAS
jgi:diguanylate cyclase (GGDEF)-like protein/PAS domain S-box-containing protein